MSNQQSKTQSETILPKLPIPRLQSTCQKFLEWTKPLLTENEWDDASRVVDEFIQDDGIGKKLQSELEEWANSYSNWLEPFWDDAYLCGREPLVFNTNPFFCPGEDALSRQPRRTQSERSVDIILGMVGLKRQIDSGTFSADAIKGNPLCMYQYQRMFSTTRIPSHQRDLLRSPDSAVNPAPDNARHTIVIHKGQIYSLEVIDQNGNIHTPGRIKSDLDSILASNVKEKNNETVGLLTALEREEWAEVRESLIALSQNTANLNCIETALFAICLDSDIPATRNDFFMALLAGEEGNRWFDKSLQFIVFPDGQYGLNMEHSGLDASPIVRIQPFQIQAIGEPEQSSGNCRRLEFLLTDNSRNAIEKARREYRKGQSNTSLEYRLFGNFGKEFIKSCGTSPDAFIQLAIQLAQFRLFGKCRSTYEAVMTRQFLHGRTEAMRPVSSEAISFVNAMENQQLSAQEKVNLFQKAAQAHVTRLAECKAGTGIQRHLYGLEYMYKRMGRTMHIHGTPSIFSSTAWQLLCHDFLSTSTAGSENGLVLAGFAPVVEDGFGICYLVSSNRISLTISSRENMKPYRSDFISAIEKALLNLGELLKQ